MVLYFSENNVHERLQYSLNCTILKNDCNYANILKWVNWLKKFTSVRYRQDTLSNHEAQCLPGQNPLSGNLSIIYSFSGHLWICLWGQARPWSPPVWFPGLGEDTTFVSNPYNWKKCLPSTDQWSYNQCCYWGGYIYLKTSRWQNSSGVGDSPLFFRCCPGHTSIIKYSSTLDTEL